MIIKTSQYFASVIIGYLLGCSNMAFYISKIKKTDISSLGSKNLGTANTLTVCGWKASIIVLVHDLCKAVAAVMIGRYALTRAVYADAVAGVSSVLGHIFPFYLKFRGGKGYASYIGMMVSLDWRYTLIAFAITLVVTMITDYIIIGNLVTVVPFPVYLLIRHRYVAALLVALTAAVVVYKHSSHLVSLAKGTEEKFWDSILRKKKVAVSPEAVEPTEFADELPPTETHSALCENNPDEKDESSEKDERKETV